MTAVSQFKASQPNTSVPKKITTEVLDSYGYDAVLNGAAATVTAPYGVSTRSGVEEISGQWFTKFVAGPVFTDTTDSEGTVTTAADNEAAYRAGIDSTAGTNVRTERDTKLTETDWTQLADSHLTDDVQDTWITYRQALRELPTARGFPHKKTWPTEPA